MKIAFIGLGIMGSRMAKNLLKEDVSLTVYNRSKGPSKELKEAGALTAESPQQCAEGADIVFTMLSNPEAVESVALGNNGFIKKMKNGALWADCSTVNPSFSIFCDKESAKYGVDFIDIPVAGSKTPAENGELIFLAGGASHIVDKAEPYMNIMGSRIIRAGDTGKGASLKIIVNSLLGLSMAAFAEAVILGKAAGFSEGFLLDTLPELPVTAPMIKMKTDMFKSGEYEAQFPLEHMHKDLHLAAVTAFENNQPAYLANIAKELYADANKKGYSRDDFAAIYKYLSEK